ncbi:hypothetical protein [Corallococcus sp. AB045]|uniref:hypothetical protein n=1 Tax=Corallococcus sp. AB045 TaxID=2316719 RepID=UPI0011C375E1|nr:hypothetical protein [Corallococcus sp. AB045]
MSGGHHVAVRGVDPSEGFLNSLLGLLPGPQGSLIHALPLVSFSPRRGSREVLCPYKGNGWLRTSLRP